MSEFRFKQFSVRQDCSALKVGTDAVLLGSMMTIDGSVRRALDIGTGTGVIALMAAQRLAAQGIRDFRITGIDIDGPSAVEAEENFSRSPWAASLQAEHLPLRETPDGSWDLIFSNPPYYDSSLRNPDPRKADARHSTELDFAQILEYASRNLTDCGRLAMVIPSEVEAGLFRTARSFGLFPQRIIRIRTTPVKPPRRIIVEFVPRRCECSETTLTIGAETEVFTKNFYL